MTTGKGTDPDRRTVLVSGLASGLSTAVSLPFQASARGLGASAALDPRPSMRWFWPGGAVNDDALRRQLRALARAGFGGVEIQAFHHGLSARRMGPARWARIDDFATPTFFAHVDAAMREAHRLGMVVDVTFGSGWPFGGPAITPELAQTELAFSHIELVGGDRLQGPLPDVDRPNAMRSFFAHDMDTPTVWPAGWPERLRRRERLVAVVASRGTLAEAQGSGSGWRARRYRSVTRTGVLDPASTILLTNRVTAQGHLDWTPPDTGPWQVFVFRQIVSDLRVVAGVGGGAQMVLDHFNKAAFAAHAGWFGSAALARLRPHVGGAWRSVFCDSLELEGTLLWADDVPQRFLERYGYDLLPWLPVLKVPGRFDGGAGGTVPLYDTPPRGDAVRRDYERLLYDLFRERFVEPFVDWAHRAGLQAKLQAHGAPADVLRAYGAADIPETESLYADGAPDFLRAAASAALLYGRRQVSAETFVHQGGPAPRDIAAMKRELHAMTIAGVNHIVFCGLAAPFDDGTAKGWYPFTPPTAFTSDFRIGSAEWPQHAALARYAARLSAWNSPGTPHWPIAVLRDELAYFETPDAIRTIRLDHALPAAGYGYCHVNPDALMSARAQGDRLVTAQGVPFELLVTVGPIHDEAARRRVTVLAAAGVTVLSVTSSESVPDLLAAIRSRLAPQLGFAGSEPLPFIERRRGSLRSLFVANPDDAARAVAITVDDPRPVSAFDPWDQKQSPCVVQPATGGQRIAFSLPASGALWLTFGRAVSGADRHRSRSPSGD